MEWSKLPQAYRFLPIPDGAVKDFHSENIAEKFIWDQTDQGYIFWERCHMANKITELPIMTSTPIMFESQDKEEPFYITYVEGSVPCHVKYSLDEAIESVEEIVMGTDSKVYILKLVQVYQREIKIKKSLI